MLYQATKKVTGGKLLRIKLEADQNINALHITGDFFLYPEEALPQIEKELTGLSTNTTAPEFSERVQQALTREKAAFIGVSPNDIAETITEALATTATPTSSS